MRKILSAAVAALTLAACSDNGTGPVPGPAPVHSIAVSPADLTLAIGLTEDLEVVLFDAEDNVLTGRTVTFTSEQPQYATVSNTGRVTAIATGTTRIIITSEGKTTWVDVEVAEVAPAVVSIQLSQATATMLVGAQLQLAAVPLDAQGQPVPGQQVSWSSDRPGTATVNTLGTVEAFAAGTAVITASVAGKSATVAVTVTTPPEAPPVLTSWRAVGIDGQDLAVALQSDLLELTPQVRKTRYAFLQEGSITWNQTAGTWQQRLKVRSYTLVEYGTFSYAMDVVETEYQDEGTSLALSPSGWFQFTSTKDAARQFTASHVGGGLETFQVVTPALRTVYIRFMRN